MAGISIKNSKIDKPKKLITEIDARGIAREKCPHCEKVIFKGYYLGVTIWDLEGKCPYCGKPVIQEEFKK